MHVYEHYSRIQYIDIAVEPSEHRACKTYLKPRHVEKREIIFLLL